MPLCYYLEFNGRLKIEPIRKFYWEGVVAKSDMDS
jgi:hypothetical protein